MLNLTKRQGKWINFGWVWLGPMLAILVSWELVFVQRSFNSSTTRTMGTRPFHELKDAKARLPLGNCEGPVPFLVLEHSLGFCETFQLNFGCPPPPETKESVRLPCHFHYCPLLVIVVWATYQQKYSISV